MLGPILVFVLIVVASAVIGAVSQVLKAAAKQPLPPPRLRAGRGAVRPASGDIDRFLEEIDRLRRRKAEGDEPVRRDPPVAKPVARPVRPPVPAAESRRPRRRLEAAPVAEARAVPSMRLADLPVAVPAAAPPADDPFRMEVTAPQRVTSGPMVTAPLRLAALPKVTSGPKVTASPSHRQRTVFDRELGAILSSPSAIPLAVVLTEILGPPKCRQPRG